MKKTILFLMLTAGLLSCADDDNINQKELVYQYWALRKLNNGGDPAPINIGEYTWDLNKANGTLTVLENFNDEANSAGLLPEGVYAIEVHGETIEVTTAGFEDEYRYSIHNGNLHVYFPGPKTSIAPANMEFESLDPM